MVPPVILLDPLDPVFFSAFECAHRNPKVDYRHGLNHRITVQKLYFTIFLISLANEISKTIR